MRDLVIGVTVVLPDGTARELGRQGREERRRLRPRQALLRLARAARDASSGSRCGCTRCPAAARTVGVGADRWRELHRSQLVPSAVDIADGRMYVLFEGSPRAVDAQAAALGGERGRAVGRAARRCRRGCPAACAGTAAARRSSARARASPTSRTAEQPPGARSPSGSWRPVQPELIADCVHCGFCLPSCPTYSLWHEEMDSPRGRIHLMSGLVDGSIALTDTVVEHFDRCLGCMACVPACPSGVQYDRLIEQTRDYVETQHAARRRRAPAARAHLRRVPAPPAPPRGARAPPPARRPGRSAARPASRRRG